MAWIIQEPNVVQQKIADTDTVQNHAFGKIVNAKDSTLGAGEFIYLKGVSGTVAGLVVTYKADGTTALGSTSGVNEGGSPLAVAMSACNLTTLFGWYQIGGNAVILKTAVKVDPAVAPKVYLSATAGRIMQTSVAGRQIIGARLNAAATVTSTTSTAIVTLNRPSQKTGTLV